MRRKLARPLQHADLDIHMTKHKRTSIEIAEVKLEMDKPRIAASALGLMAYQCSRCGCRFPETRARKGRTNAETRRLEKSHATREFARHVCETRDW